MIKWYPGNTSDENSRFSIIIPTWNNLPYLKICIDSIIKNSTFRHQIIIHVNEGIDGTLQWVQKSGFDHTHSTDNVGVCLAMNAGRALVKTDYIVYVNDDMYVLPGWDKALWEEIESIKHNYFFLSSTTIEPRRSPHRGILMPYDYGDTPENFREESLLKEFKSIKGQDWSGSTWPPNIVHKNIWDLIGGYSIEYFPGLYSDPDFSMKLYEAGIRYYKGIDSSRAYHFSSKSTQRTKGNNGSKQFLNKWGITSSSFTKHFLKRGYYITKEVQIKPSENTIKRVILKGAIKRIFWHLGGTGRTSGKYSYNNLKSNDQ